MQFRVGYELIYDCPQVTPMILMLNIHCARAGDMVTAINGTPLNDKDRAQEIFATLGSSTDARVTITRNGRQQELVLNIAQISAEAERLGNGGDGSIPMEQAPEPVPGNE